MNLLNHNNIRDGNYTTDKPDDTENTLRFLHSLSQRVHDSHIPSLIQRFQIISYLLLHFPCFHNIDNKETDNSPIII